MKDLQVHDKTLIALYVEKNYGHTTHFRCDEYRMIQRDMYGKLIGIEHIRNEKKSH